MLQENQNEISMKSSENVTLQSANQIMKKRIFELESELYKIRRQLNNERRTQRYRSKVSLINTGLELTMMMVLGA